ncbi:MAG: hypothetical protein K5798_03730 [Nitrosopumilus sp.]|uniref:hypothetical protein n=1 Tax=Nitrosopumilus sp. TaxID=2024843 RepID=UPI0024302492|nr:hypothetical protein [Nitrosopumilus sp.]MCV0366362.1 hypothetical protein [Nitrosopumilus sp.]
MNTRLQKQSREKKIIFFIVGLFALNAFGNLSPHIIGCSGGDISIGGFDDVLEKLESDWCFDGEVISIEYRK